MMKAKTLPVFAILILLSLRSAVEIEFQIIQQKFKHKGNWQNMLKNAKEEIKNANKENKNDKSSIYLNDIILTKETAVEGDNVKKLIKILNNTTLTKVTFCDLPGKPNDRCKYLRVIKDNKEYDIKNKASNSNNLTKDLDTFCANHKKELTDTEKIQNGITFDGKFDVKETELDYLNDVNDDDDSLELYIKNATNIAAVFKIGGSRKLLIL